MAIIDRVSYHRRNDTGLWRVVYYLVDGANKQRKFKSGFSTRARAERWIKDFARQLESGELEREDITFSELRDVYLDSRHHKRASSIEQDRIVIDHFANHLSGRKLPPQKTRISTITEKHINDFLAARKPAVSEWTLARDIRTLKTLFRYAVTSRYLEESPAANIRLIVPAETEVVYLDVDEQKLLYDAALSIAQQTTHKSSVDTPYIFPIIVLALRTGMRYDEILNIRRRNIDIDRRRILIANESAGDTGDAGWRTKSGRGRVVPLDDMTIEALAWWDAWFDKAIERAAHTSLTTGNKQTRDRADYRISILTACQNSPYLFPSFAKPPGPMRQFNKAWHRVRAAAGITNRFHDLRHTFAVMCIFNGVPLPLLSNLLGHSKIETTQKYLRFYEDDAAVRVRLPDFRG